MDEEIVGNLRKLLIGTTCGSMENLGNWLDIPLGPCKLLMESAWRITLGEDILASSDSHASELDQVPRFLPGKAVGAVAISGHVNDLRIEFEGGPCWRYSGFQTSTSTGSFSENPAG